MSINGINGLPEQTSREEVGKCNFLIFIYIYHHLCGISICLTQAKFTMSGTLMLQPFSILNSSIGVGWGVELTHQKAILTIQWNSLLNDPEF